METVTRSIDQRQATNLLPSARCLTVSDALTDCAMISLKAHSYHTSLLTGTIKWR